MACLLVQMVPELPTDGGASSIPEERVDPFALEDDVPNPVIGDHRRDGALGRAVLEGLGIGGGGRCGRRQGRIRPGCRGGRGRRGGVGFRCIALRAGRRRRDDEALVHEQHQQREEEGKQDSSFHEWA